MGNMDKNPYLPDKQPYFMGFYPYFMGFPTFPNENLSHLGCCFFTTNIPVPTTKSV